MLMEFAKKFSEKFAADFSKPFERVMVFVDGGYLRELCKRFGGHDNVKWARLSWSFIRMFNTYGENPFNANLIRIYYYDAIVGKEHPDYNAQRKYFDRIEAQYAYTVRLGELVESSKKQFKQKGVDILMAIDAVSKAYQKQYDTGMFMVGDRDFKPLIDAVKDAGRKTIGVFNPPTCSEELARSFDMRIFFDEKPIKDWLEKMPTT